MVPVEWLGPTEPLYSIPLVSLFPIVLVPCMVPVCWAGTHRHYRERRCVAQFTSLSRAFNVLKRARRITRGVTMSQEQTLPAALFSRLLSQLRT